MAQQHEIYKCNLCGNIVEILNGKMGVLTCCNAPMHLFQANTEDAAKEKHVPVVQKNAQQIKVTVGDVAHPMEEKHYIEWIEMIAGEKTERQFLQPNQAPEAFFTTDKSDIQIRAYCNLHGLWQSR